MFYVMRDVLAVYCCSSDSGAVLNPITEIYFLVFWQLFLPFALKADGEMQRRAVNFITMYNQHLCNTSDSFHSLHFLSVVKFFWDFLTTFLKDFL